MNGLEGICPQCGAQYYGWALCNPLYQYCGKCGIRLTITRNGDQRAQFAPGSTEAAMFSAKDTSELNRSRFYSEA